MNDIFDDILGHDNVKRGLIHAASTNHLHHALLFSGISGIGKAMLARALIQALLCSEHDPGMLSRCRKCHNCHRIEVKQHPDVLEIDQQTATISIEAIRDLQNRLIYAPFETNRRFVIIHDVHKMQDAAANCFLKTLEEPPQDTTFILLTDQIQRLIPTIISRCQVVRFAPFSIQEISQYLMRQGFSENDAIETAALSDGSLGMAMTLNSSSYKTDVLATFDDILSTESKLDAIIKAAHLKTSGEKSKDDKDKSETDKKEKRAKEKSKTEAILKLLMLLIRDMTILKSSPQAEIILTPYRERMLKRLDRFSVNDLQRAAGIIQQVRDAFLGNVNEQLAWERLMLGMHTVLY